MRRSLNVLLLGALAMLSSKAYTTPGENNAEPPEALKAGTAPTPTPGSRWPVPMPEKWIEHYLSRVAEFKQENAALPPNRKNIVFVGDSLTEGFPLEEYFPGKPVLNRGIISDGIGFDERGVLNRLDSSVFDCNPSVVVLLIGVNDLPHDWVTVDECLAGYRAMVERIQERLPKVKLVLCTVLPTGEKYSKHAYLNPRIVEFNKGLAALAAEKSLPLVDLYARYRDENGLLPEKYHRGDGLHLKGEAYGLWADEVRRYLD